MQMVTFLRADKVTEVTCRSHSTIYSDIAKGLFPKSVALGPQMAGWAAHEVAAVNAARLAGWSEDQIRDLVAKLHAARTTIQVEVA